MPTIDSKGDVIYSPQEQFQNNYDAFGNSIGGLKANANTSPADGQIADPVGSPTAPGSIQSGSTTSQINVADGFLQSSNFKTGSTGWQIKANGDVEFGSGKFRGDITGATGTFSGTVNVGSLNIPDTTSKNSFHVDTAGNMWLGTNVAAGLSVAPASITNAGIAKFTSATITGLVNHTTISGISDTYQNLINTIWEGASTVYGAQAFFSATNTFAYSSYALLVAASSSSDAYSTFGNNINLTQNAVLETAIKISSVAAQGANKAIAYYIMVGGNAAAGLSSDADPGTHFFGFKIFNDSTGTKLYAVSKDGTTLQKTDITGSLTLTNFNQMRAVFTAGSKVEFYIAGSLVATHSTNIPNSNNQAVISIVGATAGSDPTPSAARTFTCWRVIVKGTPA